MQIPQQYAAAEALERFLGDPADERSPLGFARAVEADEREQYPEQACALLDAWGLHQYYVPAGCGGRLASYEELMALVRCVARRDFTVGFVHSILPLLGGAAVWAGGSDEQKQKVARLHEQRQSVILAYNERAHGSDFLATEMKAEKVPGGYLLSGEKWLIGNAARASAFTVFARTDEQGGPRGFSLFLVEKDALDPDSFHLLPRLKTLGVRGAHVSGLRFKESFLPESARIGGEGTALEQTLKAFQQTRTVIPALSLGAADTALRCALSFALERRLYGGTAFDLAPTRRLLAGSLSDLLVADSQAVGCARALQYAPARMRLYSAAVKYYVPTLVEGVVGRAARVLGARHYLREGHWSGIFQKILRDNVVVRYHFNAALNLTTIGVHLRELAREAEGSDPAAEAERAHQRLAPVFDLRAALPSPDPSRLRLFCRGGDDLLASLPALVSRAEGPGVEPRVAASLGAALRRLTEVWGSERERQRESERRLGGGYGESPEMFEAAERYSALHAAASAAQVWVRNRNWMSEGLAGGEWLALGLMRVLRRLGAGEGLGTEAEYEAGVCAMMRQWHEEGRMFSIVPLQLAGKSGG